jgi:biotin-dependent carboxylase-like uncharacterized protein
LSPALLEVLEPGLLSTVQGSSRDDWQSLGVPRGGACDRWSLALANALLGNEPDAAGIEMTMIGATLRASTDCVLALAGAEMDARLDDGLTVPSGSALRLSAGQSVRFGAALEGSGARAYLALPGGVDVPDVLGSPSTCLVGGFGGLDGRPLRVGDAIRGRAGRAARLGHWDGRCSPGGGSLRIVRGPHVESVGEPAWRALLASRWLASGRGDRQGLRLDGPALAAGAGTGSAARGTIVSQPMAWGAIQLPPDGQPVALLADCPTVGGYPVLAVVIEADLPVLGQLAAGDPVTFVSVSLAEARTALALARREMTGLRNAV